VNGALRILVVEDDDDLLALASQALVNAGHHVTVATDAETARDQVSDPWEIDCLFTDVVLPGASGLELAGELTTQRPDLPVLFATGSQEPATRDEILATGHPLLFKPYTAAALSNALDAIRALGANRPGDLP
jgi:CheY-like chemotaxis protein